MEPQNPPFATEVRPPDEAGIAEAARLILSGFPVAVPTETVYGLAADATNAEAVARLYAAKGRPSFNPLIVHILDAQHAGRLGIHLQPDAADIARLYWPGPVTIVVPAGPFSDLARAATAGLDTVALRSPDHPVMRRLLEATGRPLAAPSANASGSISPTRAEHVLGSLGGRIPLILDGGPTLRGVESTIVKVANGVVTPLRPGPVDAEEIAGCAKLRFDARRIDKIEAPGQLKSHYAPARPLRLEATSAHPDEWLIGFGPVDGDDNLSPAGDLEEAAARLFDALHRADRQDRARIAVAPIPGHGIGLAINDRLRRAAAPRA